MLLAREIVRPAPPVFKKSCPLCRGASRAAFAKDGVDIVDCAACGHRFADYEPVPTHALDVYSDSYFEGGTGDYAAYELEARSLRKRGRWYGRRLKRYLPNGTRVLDVGSASGHILEGLHDTGWTGSGVEPNATMAARGRARGLDIVCGVIEDLDLREPVDAVTMIQVLHHVTDIGSTLRRVHRALPVGGYLVVETWDRESVVARLLGERWHAYHPPSVLHWFTKASVRALFEADGFTYVESGRPPKSISGSHGKSLLTRDDGTAFGRAIGAAAKLLPNDFEIPYPGDDVFWMAFVKSGQSNPPTAP